MRRVVAVIMLGLALSISSVARTDPVSPPSDAAPCVAYWGEVRYVVGYDQLVHLFNGCKETARCNVSTSVNPKVQVVTVAANQHLVVTTWLGSPASTFVPYVDCTLGGS